MTIPFWPQCSDWCRYHTSTLPLPTAQWHPWLEAAKHYCETGDATGMSRLAWQSDPPEMMAIAGNVRHAGLQPVLAACIEKVAWREAMKQEHITPLDWLELNPSYLPPALGEPAIILADDMNVAWHGPAPFVMTPAFRRVIRARASYRLWAAYHIHVRTDQYPVSEHPVHTVILRQEISLTEWIPTDPPDPNEVSAFQIDEALSILKRNAASHRDDPLMDAVTFVSGHPL